MLALSFACLILAANQPVAQPPAPAPPLRAKPSATYTAVGTQQLDINLPALKFFCDGKQNELQRYLEASSKWRVGVERVRGQEMIVARQREDPRGGWGDRSRAHANFTFAESMPDAGEMVSCITRAAPDAGITTVTVFTYNLIPVQRIAHIDIGAPKLWLTTVETDEAGRLAKTPGLLAAVERELNAVRRATEAGDPLSALTPEDVHTGVRTLTVDDSDKQELHVEAWMNPGEAGVAEWRVKSGDGSKDFTIVSANFYARQRIGYSDDPTQLFCAHTDLCIREIATGWHTMHDVRFQLWFTPDAGGPARKLIEHRQTVSGWEQ